MAYQHTTPDKPSHTPGTPRGEDLAKYSARRLGRYEDDATGINVEDRRPIDPRMPHMPPA